MQDDQIAPLSVPAADRTVAAGTDTRLDARGTDGPDQEMRAVEVTPPSEVVGAPGPRGGVRRGGRGGRGARERILRAAEQLFYAEGVNTTGMERLTEVAQVSKRTFYQHFPSKNALVAEYLRRLDAHPVARERVLRRDDLPARARLIALFADDLSGGTAGGGSTGATTATAGVGGVYRMRGCPFHNAAVETAGTVPDIEQAVVEHKAGFTRLLIDTAREAGAADPVRLGRQLAVLFEGAAALSTSLNDPAPLADARSAALVLLGSALDEPASRPADGHVRGREGHRRDQPDPGQPGMKCDKEGPAQGRQSDDRAARGML
ncbi:TetR/AcrR family transcriptional regulator [Frankia sp. R82]|nr:helix-turn-helix domain-containing protein [Frankia sp. R82]MCM3886195.1 TetR/AcrR family transcriptional regulator [Frankia sp. R82]